MSHDNFIEPVTEEQKITRFQTSRILTYIEQGYSVTLASSLAHINFSEKSVRARILSDEVFYDKYLEFMASRNSIRKLIKDEAIKRRGLEHVLALQAKYKRET